MKTICCNIIQNKSWLTYLLESVLKEIIHKADRCETVNIIYIDWEKHSCSSEKTESGLATSSESIILIRIKICLRALFWWYHCCGREQLRKMIKGELYSFILLPTYKQLHHADRTSTAAMCHSNNACFPVHFILVCHSNRWLYGASIWQFGIIVEIRNNQTKTQSKEWDKVSFRPLGLIVKYIKEIWWVGRAIRIQASKDQLQTSFKLALAAPRQMRVQMNHWATIPSLFQCCRSQVLFCRKLIREEINSVRKSLSITWESEIKDKLEHNAACVTRRRTEMNSNYFICQQRTIRPRSSLYEPLEGKYPGSDS